MNNITIAGSLGRDAELRYSPNGDPVASFSVADSQGKDKPTIWWNCSLWGKRAAALEPYLKKGQAVAVSGSVTEREYEKDGQKRKAQDIRVNEIALQGGKPLENGPARAPRQAPAPANSGDFSDMDDDIPFTDPMKRKAFAMAV